MAKKLFLIFVVLAVLLPARENSRKYAVLPRQRDTLTISMLIKKGTAYKSRSADSAFYYLNQALTLSRADTFTNGFFKSLIQLADLSISTGNYPAALDYYRQALAAVKDDMARMATVYTNIAHVFYLDGQYEKAANYTYRVVETANRFPDLKIKTCIPLVTLSVIWWQLEDQKKSLYYLKLAEKAARKENDLPKLADILNKTGNRYLDSPDKSVALNYYLRALNISRQCGDTGLIMIVEQNLGGYYRMLHKPRIAEDHFQKAIALIDHPDISPFFKSSMLNTLGNNYLLMEQYDKAEYFLLKSLEQSRQAGTRVYTTTPYELLSEIYAHTNRYSEAVKMQERYQPLRDSLLDNEKIKAINSLEIKYEAARKDIEIARRQLLIEKESSHIIVRNIMIAGTGFCLVCIVGFGIQFYKSRQYRRRLEDENLQLLKSEEKIQLLRATLQGEEKERARVGRELHDGTGSMLSVIKMGVSVLCNQRYIPAKDKSFDELMQLIDETAAEVRETAHNLLPDPLLNGGMEEALSIYCERLRKKHVLEITMQYYGEAPRLSKEAERSVFRILKEIIQYRITKKASAVFFQLNWQQDILSVIIEDNGMRMNDQDADWQRLTLRMNMMKAVIETDDREATGITTDLEFDLVHLSGGHSI